MTTRIADAVAAAQDAVTAQQAAQAATLNAAAVGTIAQGVSSPADPPPVSVAPGAAGGQGGY